MGAAMPEGMVGLRDTDIRLAAEANDRHETSLEQAREGSPESAAPSHDSSGRVELGVDLRVLRVTRGGRMLADTDGAGRTAGRDGRTSAGDLLTDLFEPTLADAILAACGRASRVTETLVLEGADGGPALRVVVTAAGGDEVVVMLVGDVRCASLPAVVSGRQALRDAARIGCEIHYALGSLAGKVAFLKARATTGRDEASLSSLMESTRAIRSRAGRLVEKVSRAIEHGVEDEPTVRTVAPPSSGRAALRPGAGPASEEPASLDRWLELAQAEDERERQEAARAEAEAGAGRGRP